MSLIKSWKAVLGAVLLLFGYLLYWSYTFLPDSVVPIHDNLVYHQPYFHFVLSAIKYFKEFPFWNPFVSMGMPTLPYTNNYELLMFTHYPSYLLAYFFEGVSSSLLLYKLNMIGGTVVLAFFTVLLLKEMCLSRSTLFFGGTVALFSGYTVGTFYQDQVLATALYVPLVLFLLIRLFKTRRLSYAALTGMFLGQSLNAHYPQLVIYFYSILFLSFLLCYFPVVKVESSQWSFWLKASALLGGGCLISASPLLYNYFHYFPNLVSPARGVQSDSIAVGYEFIEQTKAINSFWSRHALSFIKPRWMAAPAQANGIYADDTIPFYLGICTVIFFLFSLVRPWTRRTRFWLCTLALTALFAVGGYGFVYRLLFTWIPAARIQRTPLHMSHFMLLAIMVLACIGWEQWIKQMRARPSVVVSLLLLLNLFDLLSYSNWAAPGLVDDRSKFECLTELKPPLPPTALEWKVYDRFSRFIWFKDSFAWAAKNGYQVPGIISSASLPQGTVTRLRQTFNEVEFQTSSPTPGPLVWQQNASAGWQVSVDGERQALEKTNGVFLTATVPAGEHRVTFRYAAGIERALVYGAMATSCLALGLLWLILLRPLATAALPSACAWEIPRQNEGLPLWRKRPAQ